MVKMNLVVLLSVVILESCSGYPIEGKPPKDTLLKNGTAVEYLSSSNVSIPPEVQYGNKVVEKITEKTKDVNNKTKGGIDKIKEKFKKDGKGSNDVYDRNDRYDRITSENINRSKSDLDYKSRMILLCISLFISVCLIAYFVYLKYKEYSEKISENEKS